jgi:Protein of unknown function (DUF3035)
MRKSLLALCAIPILGACGSTGLLNRDRPDEFAVTRAAPLKVPADFSLPAPQPGAKAEQTDTRAQVLDALFGTPK